MKYTLEQIIKCWREVYGEDMETEYAGFIKELQKVGFMKSGGVLFDSGIDVVIDEKKATK